VSFLGHRDDIPGILSQADLFVLPSRSESFPNALLEAMAAGVPAVASAVGGVLDLVAHDRTGWLVPPGDASRLAHAISNALADPVKTLAIGCAACDHVRANYSFERMVAGFEAVYQDQLSRHQSHHVRSRLPPRVSMSAASSAADNSRAADKLSNA
jgi:glycosyltransferase involved in cell wall biosynthesis